MRHITTYLAAAGVAALIAGCGGSPHSDSHSHPKAAPANTSPPAAAALTCSDISGALDPLVHDQNSQNKALEEKWVSIVDGSPTSQGSDLQNAASEWQDAPSTTTVSADAAQLSTDANTFFDDTSGGLEPGWNADYKSIEHDIADLAHLCGLTYHTQNWYVNH
jgi:hypothetical protein